MSAIRLTGTLLRDAHTATGTDGTAWLLLEVAPGSGSAPGSTACKVHQCLGNGPAAQFAAANASKRLRRGTRVTVHAAAYDIHHHPAAHLVLRGISHIEQLALPLPPHARADKEPA